MTESIAPPTTSTAERRNTRDLAKVAVSGWLGVLTRLVGDTAGG